MHFISERALTLIALFKYARLALVVPLSPHFSCCFFKLMMNEELIAKRRVSPFPPS